LPPLLREEKLYSIDPLSQALQVFRWLVKSCGRARYPATEDEAKKSWRATLPPMASRCEGCAAAVLGNLLYVGGGHNDVEGLGAMSSTERFDLVSNSWLPMQRMENCDGNVGVAVMEG